MLVKLEEWRDIPEWQGVYQASTFGRIRSVKRVITDVYKGKKRSRQFPSRILKPLHTNSFGHLNVGLYLNGLGKRDVVHRLVAKTFLPNPKKLPIVDHKDGDPTNNAVENLRWVSHKTNNNNTHYVRYLQSLLTKYNIEYLSEELYER